MKVADWFVFQLLLQFMYTHLTSGSNLTFWPHGQHLSVHFRPEMEQVLSFLQYKLTKTTPALLPLAALGFRSPDRNLGSQMLTLGEHRSIFTTPQSVGVGVQSARWQERVPAGSAEKFHTPTGSGPVSPETVSARSLGHRVTWLHGYTVTCCVMWDPPASNTVVGVTEDQLLWNQINGLVSAVSMNVCE